MCFPTETKASRSNSAKKIQALLHWLNGWKHVKFSATLSIKMNKLSTQQPFIVLDLAYEMLCHCYLHCNTVVRKIWIKSCDIYSFMSHQIKRNIINIIWLQRNFSLQWCPVCFISASIKLWWRHTTNPCPIPITLPCNFRRKFICGCCGRKWWCGES